MPRIQDPFIESSHIHLHTEISEVQRSAAGRDFRVRVIVGCRKAEVTKCSHINQKSKAIRVATTLTTSRLV